MLTWINENIITILICAVLAAIVCAIIINLVHNKKKGKSSCGCNCAHCALAGKCHELSKNAASKKK